MGAAGVFPQRPRVTILLLTWRDRGFIDEALAGALAQTVPCEIVVSNDRSGDGTHERCEERLQGYTGPHRIATVRCNEQNLGVAAHLSAAMAHASGEIIVMMAGDDISAPRRVERLLELFDREPDVMAAGSEFVAIDADGREVALPFRTRRERFGLRYFVQAGRLIGLLGATLAFRREVFDRFGPLRGPIEDNALSLRAALLGECRVLREPLVSYRQHGGSVSAAVFAKAEPREVAKRRRYERTIQFYRGTADDFEAALGRLPDLAPRRRRLAQSILAMYRIEADAREALLQPSRKQWLGPICRGLKQHGMRRKSLERALKLLVPRRWAGLT